MDQLTNDRLKTSRLMHICQLITTAHNWAYKQM